jgi:tetratricopeptide (TPR) repeat protein
MTDTDASSTTLSDLFDTVLDLVIDRGARAPAPCLSKRLRGLFKELQAEHPCRPVEETLDLIWAHWISHSCDIPASLMVTAIEAIAARDFARARPVLDQLVALEPDWSEAWNKRATLSFIEGRDAEALADIAKTLELEPRHFGAVSGFGQICLRHGRYREAKAAFQVALAINPHLQGLREAIAEIDGLKSPVLH